MNNTYFKDLLKNEKAIFNVAKIFDCHCNQVAYFLQKFVWLPQDIKYRIYFIVSGIETKINHADQSAIHEAALDFHLTDHQAVSMICDYSCLDRKTIDRIASLTL